MIKDHLHWMSRFQSLSETPIKITEIVNTVKSISLIIDSYTHLHFVVSDERIRQKEVFSQWASEGSTGISAMTHRNTSDWPLHSKESCVIGYNAQRCKTRLSLAQRQQAITDLNLAADDMTCWTYSHRCDCIKINQILIGYFLSFGSCIQLDSPLL